MADQSHKNALEAWSLAATEHKRAIEALLNQARADGRLEITAETEEYARRAEEAGRKAKAAWERLRATSADPD
ncbi:hypothetical protein [Microbaculum marinum]|uniref:Uncharacterized protein n=1 Tax=Microbaculum marinum TaxID=1764581 RepID=A0AAW9RMD2_9HYPH